MGRGVYWLWAEKQVFLHDANLRKVGLLHVQNLAKTCKKEKPTQVAEAIEWEVGAAEITGKFLTGGN